MDDMRLPLTPALSPSEGERESRPPSSRVPEKPRTSDALSLDSNRPTIPPLPLRGGEGRGEGADLVPTAFALRIDH